ncbi:MAG: kelch repeat-containing protein [Anaerolineae bacterium]|nr:LuxR C-terminal-related transcriptional regulator [Thermoflexales bacterium]MDW8406879.1 kelch repeat-containing protein [Anaerolineae bacterium]
MAEPGEPLTERELEVVRLLSTGAGNKEIAAQLHLSPNTVKVHLRNIFIKLEAQSRVEVTMIAVRNGWIMPAADGASETPGSDGGQTGESVTNTYTETVDTEHPLGAGKEETQAESAAQTANTAPSNPPLAESARDETPKSLIAPVPVAPNPQPLPPLSAWRRALIALIVVVSVAGSIASLPARGVNSTAGNDGAELIDTASLSEDLLAPGEATRWHLRSPLPTPRARSTAVAVNGLIYVIGGEVNQVASGDVLVFDPLNNTWTALNTSKPTPAWNAAAAAVGNVIYVSGGATSPGIAGNQLEAFDTQRGTWQRLSPLPSAVAGHSMAALNGKLYVFGDKAGNAATIDSFEYDIAGDRWRAIAPMPTPRNLTGAAAFEDRIYVIGGYDEGREFAVCEVYRPADNSWASCAPMQLPRGGPGIIRIANSLYAIGGGWSGFIGFNERYDPQQDRWTSIETPLIGDWRGIAVAALPTEFYVIGGYSNGRRLAFTYVYEVFSNRTFLPAFQAGPESP